MQGLGFLSLEILMAINSEEVNGSRLAMLFLHDHELDVLALLRNLDSHPIGEIVHLCD